MHQRRPSVRVEPIPKVVERARERGNTFSANLMGTMAHNPELRKLLGELRGLETRDRFTFSVVISDNDPEESLP